MKVFWSFNYRIEISPFKPIVDVAPSQCYNTPFTLTQDPNKPLFYDNSESLYKWEYGVFTNELVVNPEFTYFLNNIAYFLDYDCQQSFNIDCNKIHNAIINTDYEIMKYSLYLYDDMTVNKEEIATILKDAISIDPKNVLTWQEQEFIDNYFINAALEVFSWPKPYTLFSGVKNWLALEPTPNYSIDFIPKDHFPELTGKVRFGFRTRAYIPASGRRSSDKYGPYSEIPIVDIFP